MCLLMDLRAIGLVILGVALAKMVFECSIGWIGECVMTFGD